MAQIAANTVGASLTVTIGNGGAGGNGSGGEPAGATGSAGVCRITEFFG
jgi:hypothetical protein